MRHDGHTEARKALVEQSPLSADAPKFTVIIRFPLAYMVDIALDLYPKQGSLPFGVSRNNNDEGMLQIWDINNTDANCLAVYLHRVFETLKMENRYIIQLAQIESISPDQNIRIRHGRPSSEDVNMVIDTTRLSQILTSGKVGNYPPDPNIVKRYVVAVLYDSLPDISSSVSELTTTKQITHQSPRNSS